MLDLKIRKRPGANRIALEVIEFQNNKFGIDIEAVVIEIRDALQRGEIIDHLCTKLEKLIMTRTGLNVQIVYDWDIIGIVPMSYNKSNTLLIKEYRGHISSPDQALALREAQGRQGTVDLKHAKVSGLFSDIKSSLNVNFDHLFTSWKMEPADITAMILHELGHAFTMFEYEDRLQTANQILSNIAKHMSSGKSLKQEYIYEELKSLNSVVTPEDVETIISGNRIIAGHRLLKLTIGSLSSQMPNDVYDRTSAEQLADNFATRFGYGRQLISALHKLDSYFEDPNRYKNEFKLSMVTSNLGRLIKLALSVFVIINLALPFAVILSFILYWVVKPEREFLRAAGDANKSYIYDDYKDRFKRMQNEFVASLKDTRLPKEDIVVILENIEYVNAVIKETKSHVPLFTAIANVIYTDSRTVKKAVDEQRLLEDLAHNDLFIKAAQLKTI
jgi:hypothetical protein